MHKEKENAGKKMGLLFPQNKVEQLQHELFELKEKSTHNRVISEVFINYLSTVPLDVELSKVEYANIIGAYYSSLKY